MQRSYDLNRQLDHINRMLYWWGHYIRGGMTCQGVYNGSQWSTGKPVKAAREPRRGTKRPKPLLPYCQPKESRTAGSKTPCLRIDTESENIHKAVLKLPDDYKPVLVCIYIRGMSFRDIADKFELSSHKFWKLRRNILLSIKNQL